MAGKPGMKGGGGLRPGAGRKKKATTASASSQITPIEGLDMLEMLQAVALGKVPASLIQVRAAIAAVQYTHTKRADGGKKEEQASKAKTAGQGKFKPAPTPLKLVGAK